MMGRGRDVYPISRANARATAKRFRVAQEGLPSLAPWAASSRCLPPGRTSRCDIWGPRRGKTASRAIPTLLAAPAAAFATSNKPDLYAATRLLREQFGQVWNFDPEQLTGGQPQLVVEPAQLRHLRPPRARAHRRVRRRLPRPRRPPRPVLRSRWARARRQSVAGRGPRQAADHAGAAWSTRPTDDEPARILQDHGLELACRIRPRSRHSPFEQRGGVFGTARQILSFLRDPDIARWVTQASSFDQRPQLDLAAFVQSTGTLYLHSKEGQGSSAGLVTALGDRIVRRRRATRQAFARRPPGPAARRGARRGRQHLPLAPAARPLLPLRLARDLPAHAASVLVPRRTSLGPERHAQTLGVRQHPRLRRRSRRTSSSSTSRS